MNKYGIVALKAVQMIKNDEKSQPLTIWNMVASDVFGEGSWAECKGCPKNAFLGLCEEGLVKGIPKGNYTHRSISMNKAYAVEAVKQLNLHPELANDKRELWREVMQGVKKSHNSQMDVVLALWNNDLIVSE